jgi:hypothetical protein
MFKTFEQFFEALYIQEVLHVVLYPEVHNNGHKKKKTLVC